MATYPILRRLPVSHSYQIGRVITRWAVVEWQLKSVANLLLGVSPGARRLGIRTARAADYITMYEDLIKLRKMKVSSDLKLLKRALKDIEEDRNQIADGVWLKHPTRKTPHLQLTKGKWHAASTRVIDPEMVPVTVKNLRDLVRSINIASRALSFLEEEIRAPCDGIVSHSDPNR